MLKCGAKITPDVSSEVSDWHKLIHGLRSTGALEGFRLQSLFPPTHEPVCKSCALLLSDG